MLPDEVVSDGSVGSFKRHFDMGFGVIGICIIITKPTCSTRSHNVIVILVKFLL